MDFYALLDQVVALLRQRQRVTYRALKRHFQLDDSVLEDLKVELIKGQRLAADEDGDVLVWTGDGASASVPAALAPAPLTYTPSYLAEKILTTRSALEGERKQVTVLFADLKGSMELLADRDPEEARQLLDPVLERMMAAVHRYEGTVNQVMGDGIMALFGAPLAHEDHAVRACYAALRMQEAVKQYATEVQRTHGVPLHMRVGLNAGEVVVRSIGSDLHMDYTAVGQTTHLAARMEQMAMPGSTLITAAVLALAESFIAVKPLGPVPVKGLATPVEVYEVVDVGPVRTRLQAAVARGLTRFVGRAPELNTLHQALTQAGAGHGQVVALVGEAGVGKSRLVYEFLHAQHTRGWLLLTSNAVAYDQATPYLPVVDLLKGYCGIDTRDDQRRQREKVVGKVLGLDAALHPTLPALLALLEVPVDEPQWQTLDPPQRRQRTLDALTRVLLRESQVQPLLVVFEDLHWIDTETQALLESLVESLPTCRLLVLLNYRPEYQHGWGSKTYYTHLRLDPLPPASAEAFLADVLGDDPSLTPLTTLLIARTEGNPFFLEESVRTLVETGGVVGAPGAYRLAQALPTIQVPATVQAVLAARIDRLPPEEKHLLQTAAVIGTEASLPLVQAIADVPEAALHQGLAHLHAAEFLSETWLFPERAFAFKHALTHEVAYSSLLQERRRTLHARIIEAMETLYADRLADHVERLAHHALRGAVWEKAVTYCCQAGTKAFARSAHREAVTCFEQALAALQRLPECRGTLEQAIDLRFELRTSLLALGDLGRLLDHLRAAQTLAEALDDARRLGWVLSHLSAYFWQASEHDRALDAGHQALTRAVQLRERALEVTTHVRLGQVYHARGDYRRAVDVLRRNVASLAGEHNRERFGLPGAASVFSRTWLSWCLAACGAFAEGLTQGEAGMQIAEGSTHPYTLTLAYLGIGGVHLAQGDLRLAMARLERGLGLCQVWTLPILFPMVASHVGYAWALAGRVAEALPLLQQAVEQAGAMRRKDSHALRVAWLSEAYLLAGRSAEALPLAQHALELSCAHKERGHEAWTHRLLAAIYAHQAPAEAVPAAAAYRQALTLAEDLGMRPLQAHCHRGLGMLYAATGQREPARTALATAMAMYRAMDMTFWLPQTEAALMRVDAR